ncbi:MAG: SLC13 family permease [Nitrospirales bacterium]
MSASPFDPATLSANEPVGTAFGRWLGFGLGPLAALVLYLAPLPFPSPEARSLGTILAWVVCYWIAEPIPLPITALLGTAACVVFGLGSARTVFAAYAHPIIFLFIGSFFLAEAMALHGVDRRFAAWVLDFRWVKGRLSRVLIAMGAITAVLSMWISNTAASALMLPIAMGMLSTLSRSPDLDLTGYRVGLLLMLSYAATAGGVSTIIGTPPNLLGVGLIAQQAGVTISFLTWMAIGVPVALLMWGISSFMLLQLHPPRQAVVPDLARHLAEQRRALGPWTRGQVNACVAFALAVTCWILPGLAGAIWGAASGPATWLRFHLPIELVALLASGLLFFLPTDWRAQQFTLSWKQATNISWGTILLFGGGLAFGAMMVKTGLSQALGEGMVGIFGIQSVWALTAIAIVVAVLLSELASNTASASMLLPIVIAIAQSADLSPIPPAIGVCLGASLGFALPVSTPPNAIIYGTGLVPIRSMVRAGLLFDLLGMLVVWTALRLLCPLVGLT